MPTGSPLLSRSLQAHLDSDVKFAEPWEAKAFAIIVKLAQAGHFTWSEWVDCFSAEVAAATAAEVEGRNAKTYYEQWLSAAEKLLIAKGMTTADQLTARRFAIASAGPTHLMK